ncbi:iron-containing alcohol dehydrogenase [Pseudalkalibacillus sp. R45]|uniref:iron-containing alcohol dehydrogenase n=1 Tax=Pseudalkalibacillus sp. R45 TaxID=3457433 RepID=UPI003FCEBC91
MNNLDTSIKRGFNKGFCPGNTEPTTKMVKEGAKDLEAYQFDWIIGIGGGSAMDVAKAIWLILRAPGPFI